MNGERPVTGAEASRLVQVLDQATERLSRSFQFIAQLQGEIAQKDRELARRSRLEMLGRMASTLAHEIRNPLGGIQLYVELLRRDVAHEQQRTTCDQVLGAVRELDRLVEDMLTYGRDAEPARTPCELGPLIDEALALASVEPRLTVERRYRLQKQPRLDPSMVKRVFLNLAVNAGQAMETGRLVIETDEADGGARIAFRDDGPGIPADQLPRLFTPFFTTRAQGTGLGLAIAQKIVEAHGGAIRASHAEPRGAEFVIHLPI